VANKKTSLSIRWQRAPLSDRGFGHGFCIYARRNGHRGQWVAFVEGFEWLRGGRKAVVRFNPQAMPTNKQALATFKAAVEARIRAGDFSIGEIVPGYWGIANA
jgi:hypothetical protein